MNAKIIELQELNHDDRAASVKLVSIDGDKFVLKTDTPREIAAQKYFNDQLQSHGLPALLEHMHVLLQPNQMLLEYIEDSPVLAAALSEENARKWGEAVANVHRITTKEFMVLDKGGKQVPAVWRDCLRDYIRQAMDWHRSLEHRLDEPLLINVEKILLELLDYSPSEFSLAHGDLHVHNVLMKEGKLILFDKFSEFMVAPAAFDLGVVYAESFAGAAYPTLKFSTANQRRLFAAFQQGYGPLPAEQQKWLDHFVLLRAFYRWPNRFAPHSGEIIRFLAAKLSRGAQS